MSITFTTLKLKSLKYEGLQAEYVDNTPLGVPGQLGIRIGKNRKSWYIIFRRNNKRKKCNIGQYPTVGLSDARILAVEKLLAVKDGIDLQEDKKANGESATMCDLWEAYQESLDLKKKKKAPFTLYAEKLTWARDFKPVIGKIKVTGITPLILSELLDKKAKKTPVAANRLHALLSVMYRPALKKGWITIHPLQWIEKPGGSEPPRKRVLSSDEIRTLWPYFEKLKNRSRAILKLGLLTAQRPGEIYRMAWQDVDFDKNEWTVCNTKNGTDHIVPLAEPVQRILLDCRYGSILYDPVWVFPANTSEGHVNSVVNDRMNIRKKSGIEDWTSHDLRRTARTIMARLRIEPHICERVLVGDFEN